MRFIEERVDDLERLAIGFAVAVEQVVDPLQRHERGAHDAPFAPARERRNPDREKNDEVARMTQREARALRETTRLDPQRFAQRHGSGRGPRHIEKYTRQKRGRSAASSTKRPRW